MTRHTHTHTQIIITQEKPLKSKMGNETCNLESRIKPNVNLYSGKKSRSDYHFTDGVETKENRFMVIIRNFFSSITISDEKGTLPQIVSLLVVLLVSGVIISLLVDILKFFNHDQHLKITGKYFWIEPLSSSLGYTYFLSWSVSFYPQILLNYNRKMTSGLSVDFCLLNVVGFACYSFYNVAFFWNNNIQLLYKERSGGATNMVRGNDVAFALHAFALSSFTYGQIFYYHYRKGNIEDEVEIEKETNKNKHNQKSSVRDNSFFPMKSTIYFVTIVIVGAILYALAIFSFNEDSQPTKIDTEYSSLTLKIKKCLNWLDFCYALSSVKIMITFLKYVPQVILNFQRKSTQGWIIWMIVLDIYGGILSIVQLILDCWNANDWGGISGNMAKFLLGFVSIVFDIIFIIQHYVLYRQNDNNTYARIGEIESELQKLGAGETECSLHV